VTTEKATKAVIDLLTAAEFNLLGESIQVAGVPFTFDAVLLGENKSLDLVVVVRGDGSSARAAQSSIVEVGQTVKAGQTLCIIEAMKMLNQIEADRAGVVVEVLADNEKPVEFDQPLFAIDPA